MVASDPDDRPRLRLLDALIIVAAFAVASYPVRGAFTARPSPTPADHQADATSMFLATASMLSHFLMILHHMLVGDRADFGFGGALGLGLFGSIVFAAITVTLAPAMFPAAFYFILVTVPLCVALACFALLLSLVSRGVRERLDWLAYHGLASTLLGGLWVGSILYQFLRY